MAGFSSRSMRLSCAVAASRLRRPLSRALCATAAAFMAISCAWRSGKARASVSSQLGSACRPESPKALSRVPLRDPLNVPDTSALRPGPPPHLLHRRVHLGQHRAVAAAVRHGHAAARARVERAQRSGLVQRCRHDSRREPTMVREQSGVQESQPPPWPCSFPPIAAHPIFPASAFLLPPFPNTIQRHDHGQPLPSSNPLQPPVRRPLPPFDSKLALMSLDRLCSALCVPSD